MQNVVGFLCFCPLVVKVINAAIRRDAGLKHVHCKEKSIMQSIQSIAVRNVQTSLGKHNLFTKTCLNTGQPALQILASLSANMDKGQTSTFKTDILKEEKGNNVKLENS